MIKNAEPITSADFNKGLVTRADFLKGDTNASPNCADVQWRFDGAVGKRYGSNSLNLLAVARTAGFSVDTNKTLPINLVSYWNLDESGSTRTDTVSAYNLASVNSTGSGPGIIAGAASCVRVNSNCLEVQSSKVINTMGQNFTLSAWVFLASTDAGTTASTLLGKGNSSTNNLSFKLTFTNLGDNNRLLLSCSSDGSANTQISTSSFGGLNTSNWYHVLVWHSGGSHIGVAVNLSKNTSNFTGGIFADTSGYFQVGANVFSDTSNANLTNCFNGKVDELGYWDRVLTNQEMTDLFNAGSASSFTPGQDPSGWASFDFGASSIRWLTIAAGTGIYASSNMGATTVSIATTRTATYQYLDRSKNVLIATSDAYDPPLFWAGSAGTFASILAINSAPSVKFSVNYNGFLILLNSAARKRGFFYADENLQLTDAWTNSFDIPSSADDEITAVFILYKFLYVSTRYKIYRVSFVGGNPDWSYLKVKDWGYVPRTVGLCSLKGGGQVAVGLDWDRRLRVFDGFDDFFLSDAVENDNKICDFAMSKISYAGSGLVISNAVLNPINQEYRLNVAIGANSTQTTHGILLNVRSLAFYPYSNQQWQTMCIAESNNQRHLVAVDRSGFLYILDSGNLDKGVTPINEFYDSPVLFSKSPEVVSKGKNLNLFFAPGSCGTLYSRDRVDLSNIWSPMVPLSDAKGNTQFTGAESSIKIQRNVNVPAVYNTYQFQITSSAGTATPWALDRFDYLQQGFGVGRGNN